MINSNSILFYEKKKIYNTDQFYFSQIEIMYGINNGNWYKWTIYWHKMTSSNYFVYILELVNRMKQYIYSSNGPRRNRHSSRYGTAFAAEMMKRQIN